MNLDDMIGPAVVVDCRPLIDTVPKGTTTHLAESPVISRDYLERWEADNGRFADGDIVLRL